MNALGIFIIASFVTIVGGCLILGRAAARKEAAMREANRRRAEDYDREKLMSEPWPSDDTDTKTWPNVPGRGGAA